jgi:hypothetical protein
LFQENDMSDLKDGIAAVQWHELATAKVHKAAEVMDTTSKLTDGGND